MKTDVNIINLSFGLANTDLCSEMSKKRTTQRTNYVLYWPHEVIKLNHLYTVLLTLCFYVIVPKLILSFASAGSNQLVLLHMQHPHASQDFCFFTLAGSCF